MDSRPFDYLILDNAGKVFPGQNSKRWSNVYRMSVQLREEIEPETLRKALSNTFDRLPSFRVRMRKGFFSNYFEPNDRECPVRKDIKNPCYRIDYRENNGYLLRVFYHKSRISIDVYHALCDGYGSAVFLATLAGEYLRLRGHSITYNQFVLDTREKPRKEEYEDAYERYAMPKGKCSLLETAAYHKKGTKQPLHLTNYTSIIMPFSQLHAVSKSYEVTVTELVAAILLDIHYRHQLKYSKSKKDVSVQIPINLRKGFPSPSVRNFVICLSVKISPKKKEYTFEEIVSSVSSQLRAVNNKDFLHAYITQTVNLQTKTLRFVPLAVKNLFVKIGFAFGAEYSTTALLSNLGQIVLPDGVKQQVERAFFFNGPGIVNGSRCAAVSCGDSFVLTFSNRYKEGDTERELMERMSELGIDVTFETNRDEGFDIDGVTQGDADAWSKEIYIPSKKDRRKPPKIKLPLGKRLKQFFC